MGEKRLEKFPRFIYRLATELRVQFLEFLINARNN